MICEHLIAFFPFGFAAEASFVALGSEAFFPFVVAFVCFCRF